MLRFEDCGRHLAAIAAFAGVSALELALANRSGDKPLPFDLAALAERIYVTRCARFFGYSILHPAEPAARFAARLRRARLRRQ